VAEIHSYPKVFALGHGGVKDLFSKFPVYVQEKIDGSQISFMWDGDGNLYVRSKGKVQYSPNNQNPDDLFKEAVDYLLSIEPPFGVIDKHFFGKVVFRGEWLRAPRHNVLAYSRRPKNGLILFDVEVGEQDFVAPDALGRFAEALDVEYVPVIDVLNERPTLEQLDEWLQRESILGGVTVEGVVLKNYQVFGADKKVLMAKYVSDKFREKHKVTWNKEDPIAVIIAALRTEQRWLKAVQHLRDNGELEFSPRDITKLIQEAKRDLIEEEQDWIKEQLWKAFHKKIVGASIKGLPEWYKEWLARQQLDAEAS